MHELMFQAGVKGMSERSELIPCNIIIIIIRVFMLLFPRHYELATCMLTVIDYNI